MTDRLVFLHGFTQTHHHWHPIALDLAATIDPAPALAFVDLPGHGLSAHDRTTVADAGLVAALAGPGTYVGYSMGGRFALAAALDRPDLVERLVLIGATAGIDDDAERVGEVYALDHEPGGLLHRRPRDLRDPKLPIEDSVVEGLDLLHRGHGALSTRGRG